MRFQIGIMNPLRVVPGTGCLGICLNDIFLDSTMERPKKFKKPKQASHSSFTGRKEELGPAETTCRGERWAKKSVLDSEPGHSCSRLYY